MKSHAAVLFLAMIAVVLSVVLPACDDSASKPAAAPPANANAGVRPTRDRQQRPAPLRPEAQPPLRTITTPALILDPSQRTASTQPAPATSDDAPAAVFSVAWSPDGTLIATGSDVLTLWDARTMRLARLVRRIDLPPGQVPSLAFSPDGKLIASWMDADAGGAADGRVYDVATGAVRAAAPAARHIWLTRDGGAISRTGPSVPGAGAGGGAGAGAGGADPAVMGVVLRNVLTDQPLCSFHLPPAAPTAAAVSPDGKLLAVACEQVPGGTGKTSDLSRIYRAVGQRDTLAILSTDTGKEIHRIDDLAGGVEALAFSPNGRLLAGACEDCTVRVWDLTTWRELLTGVDATATQVVFSADSTLVAVQNLDRTATVFDLTTKLERFTFNDTEHGWVEHLVFSPDGTLIAGNRGTKVGVWDALSGTMLAELDGHSEDVHSVAFSPDGKRLVSGGADGVALVWDVTTIVPPR